jgi:8-oxo-dGTP pyrophosphatase MutT (NUDIX family)
LACHVRNISELPEELQPLVRYMPFVKIRELIEVVKNTIDDEAGRVKYFQKNYIVDAFLGNREADSANAIAKKDGQYYRVDNSFALRNRGPSNVKIKKKSDSWDPYLLPELKSLRARRPHMYETITGAEFTTQAKAVLSKTAALMRAFEEIAIALVFGADMREELSNMLIKRLQVLQMLITPGTAYPADLSRPVSGLTAAGMFITCDLSGIAHVLLGARKSSRAETNNTWVTLGGKSDYSHDDNLMQTASREIYEETTGLLNILSPLTDAPFHDLVQEDFLFRLYFVPVGECFPVDTLHQAHRPTSLRHNHHTGAFEYHRFQWFPVKTLSSVSADGMMGSSDGIVYREFAAMLQVPHVQSVIERIERNQTIAANRHTQSAPVRGSITATYGTFASIA